MIHYITTPILSKLFWIVFSFFVSVIELNYIPPAANIPSVSIDFESAYFYLTNNNDVDNPFKFYNYDSAYLTQKMEYIIDENDLEDKIQTYILEEWNSYLLQFYYGRFYFKEDLQPTIIIASKRSNGFFFGVFDDASYLGNIEVTAFYDTITIPEESKKLIQQMGLYEYEILFTAIHELCHYIDFAEMYLKGYDFQKMLLMHRSEKEINEMAYEIISNNSKGLDIK